MALTLVSRNALASGSVTSTNNKPDASAFRLTKQKKGRTMKLNDWWQGRVFQFVHQHNLVYNTCWEDPRLDRTALELSPSDRVMVITSAGCNPLDYVL